MVDRSTTSPGSSRVWADTIQCPVFFRGIFGSTPPGRSWWGSEEDGLDGKETDMDEDTRVGGDGLVRLEDPWLWPVVIFRGARDNEPKPRKWDALSMCRALGVHKPWRGQKVDAPAWSPVTMKPGTNRRKKDNVASVSMLVLDCDAGDPLEVLEGLGDDFVRIGHTSWSHSHDKPKARLVFPFRPSWPCPVDEWGAVWAAAARWAASEGVTVDPAAKDPSRLYFGPYHPPDIVSEEDAVAWVYAPDGSRGGTLPDRPRRYLCWARLLELFPAPEEELDVFEMPAPTAGRRDDSNERQDRRRRAFGIGMVRSRADRLARAGKGGRNNSLYGAARLVAQLEAAGAVDASEALAVLEAGAKAAGLGSKEIRKTLAGGYATGRNDPAYPVEKEMGL